MASILLVDDVESVRMALGYCLDELGHSVICAEDGAQGLRAAGEAPVDLVLLDVDMPRMNGFEVCAALRADPRLCRLPVVMMSGRASPDLESRARTNGARALLRKPFGIEDLRSAIDGAIGPGSDPTPA
jgi:CheY-like chemotaxis protein